jgi:ABC-2 type transport system permease protein
MAANMMSQVLVVFVLMFSPLNFPPDRLPGWLTGIHAVLPVQAMGEVLRGTLAPASFPLPAGAFLILGAWALGSFGVAWRVMERRG